MTVTQWANRFRILDSKTSAAPGPWRTSLTPYLAGVMDAFDDPEVEEIVFCKPTQVGGTESIFNMLGKAISHDPSPALIVYPTLELALYTSNNRIQPMVELSPALRGEWLPRQSRDLELQFTSMYVALAGANSPASLATRPIRFLFLDEVDKYPAAAKKEADPISLARERTKTFINRKIVQTSTPTYKGGHIWKAMTAASELRRFHVPCPHCGHFQALSFKSIKWPEGSNAEDARDLAWYECESCKGRITDAHKPVMLKTGEWKAERSRGRRSVAFHLNTLYSPWVRFGDVAYKYLRSKDDRDERKNFANSWLAEPWEENTHALSPDTVAARQTGYAKGVVPHEAYIVSAGVDVQKDIFYWAVRAWGPRLTSWGIAHGIALSWDEVEQVLNHPWVREDGEPMQINLAGIDSGARTDEVYEFCLINSDWTVAVKGSSQRMLARYRISRIDRTGSRADGMRLVLVDTAQFKSFIAGRLNRPNGVGSWMVHADTESVYMDHIASEQCVVVQKGGQDVEVWEPKTSASANHWLDAEVYAAAAAELMGARYLADEVPAETTAKPPSGAPPNQRDGQQGSWLTARDGWMK